MTRGCIYLFFGEIREIDVVTSIGVAMSLEYIQLYFAHLRFPLILYNSILV